VAEVPVAPSQEIAPNLPDVVLIGAEERAGSKEAIQVTNVDFSEFLNLTKCNSKLINCVRRILQ